MTFLDGLLFHPLFVPIFAIIMVVWSVYMGFAIGRIIRVLWFKYKVNSLAKKITLVGNIDEHDVYVDDATFYVLSRSKPEQISGCVDGDDNIRISTGAFMLPDRLLRFLLEHELAHIELKHGNVRSIDNEHEADYLAALKSTPLDAISLLCMLGKQEADNNQFISATELMERVKMLVKAFKVDGTKFPPKIWKLLDELERISNDRNHSKKGE
jgi:hypothetical protein